MKGLTNVSLPKALLVLILPIFFIDTALTDASTVEQLPHIEGTPLLNQASLSWTLLDSDKTDNEIRWAWLSRGNTLAYLTYPSALELGTEIIFPDGYVLNAMDAIQLHLESDGDENFIFTRFGGEIILSGSHIALSYTPGREVDLETGNTYEIFTEHLNIPNLGAHIEGEVISIRGTNTNDLFIFKEANWGSIQTIDGSDGQDSLQVNNANNTFTTDLSTAFINSGIAYDATSTLTSQTFELTAPLSLSEDTLIVHEQEIDNVIFENTLDNLGSSSPSESFASNVSQQATASKSGGSIFIWELLIVLAVYFGRGMNSETKIRSSLFKKVPKLKMENWAHQA